MSKEEYSPNKLGGKFVPYTEMTDEQKHEFHVRGGKASKKKAMERRELRKYLEVLLESETRTGNVAEDMCWKLISKALKGDTKAFEIIRDTIGEVPTKKVEASVDNKVINITLEDEE